MLNYKCIKCFFSTDCKDISSFILRIALGIVIFAHGWQKLFWLWWGNGFDGTMWFFTETMWLPYIVALLVILGESLWAIALILWFATRFMAFGIFVIMTWAMFMAHLKYWFYIDWFWMWTWNWVEFHILTIAMSIALMIKWGWFLAFDSFLKKFIK